MKVENDPEVTALLFDSLAGQVETLHDEQQNTLSRLNKRSHELLMAGFSVLFARHPEIEKVMWRWYEYTDYDDNNYYSGERIDGPYLQLPAEYFDGEYPEWNEALQYMYDTGDNEDGHELAADRAKYGEAVTQDTWVVVGRILYNFRDHLSTTYPDMFINGEIEVTRDGQWTRTDYHHS